MEENDLEGEAPEQVATLDARVTGIQQLHVSGVVECKILVAVYGILVCPGLAVYGILV